MLRSFESPRRRRLHFDPLEGRQLLNGGGGDFRAHPAAFGPDASGPMVVSSPATEGDAGGWSGFSGPVDAGRGPAPFMGADGRGPMDGNPGPSATGPAGGMDGPATGRDGWAAPDQSMSATPSPGGTPGSPGTPPLGQPSLFLIAATTIGSPSAASPSGLNGAAGGGASASISGGKSALTGTQATGGSTPGGLLLPARAQEPALSPFTANPSPLPPLANGPAGPLDQAMPGAVFAAPLDTTAGAFSTASQAPIAPVSSPAAGAAPANSGTPAAPGPIAAAAPQHPLAVDSHAATGDRAVALAANATARGDLRGALDPARGAASTGRIVLAANPAHPEAESSWPGSDPIAAAADDPAPLPRGADLIAEALPFAGDSLERSLEEFVRQLEGVDVAGIVTHGPTPMAVASLAVAGAAASTLVARELLRRRAGRGRGLRLVDPRGRELALSFPEVPRSWSARH